MTCKELLEKLLSIQSEGYDLDKINIIVDVDSETLKDDSYLHINGSYHQKCDLNYQLLQLYYYQY
jgi:hypothetical protein